MQPAIDDLRALPRPDEPRQRVLLHPLVVLERPVARPAPTVPHDPSG